MRGSPSLIAMLGGVCLLAVVGIDIGHLGISLIIEGRPVLVGMGLVRMALVASGAALLVAAAVAAGRATERRDERWDAAASAAVDARNPDLLADRSAPLVWAGLVLALASAALFAVAPLEFHHLSLESGPVENGSAALAALAGAVCLFAAHAARTRGAARLAVGGCVGLGVVLLTLAGEEVSWFQRVLEFETPEALRRNLQGEANLHNLATNEVENVYYFGTFLFLVVVPFLWTVRRWVPPAVAFFVAGRGALLVASLSMAFNYDMWNGIFTQLAFFGTLFVLVALWRRPGGADGGRLILCVLAAVVLIQGAFLARGESIVRLWEVTEFKELFIPLAYFVYALELARRALRLESVASAPPERSGGPPSTLLDRVA